MESKTYRILIKKSAAKEIRNIKEKKIRVRITDKISRLAQDPRPKGCQKLVAGEAYRVRIGRHRVIYTIEDNVLVIEVIRVAHRKTVYR